MSNLKIYSDLENKVSEQITKDMTSGLVVTINAELYNYWMSVLPPISMARNSFYFAEGYSDIIHFWSEIDSNGDQRYFCQNTFMKNRLF